MEDFAKDVRKFRRFIHETISMSMADPPKGEVEVIISQLVNQMTDFKYTTFLNYNYIASFWRFVRGYVILKLHSKLHLGDSN